MQEYNVPVNVLKIPTLLASLKPEEHAQLKVYYKQVKE